MEERGIWPLNNWRIRVVLTAPVPVKIHAAAHGQSGQNPFHLRGAEIEIHRHDAFLANVRILTDNMEYFRREPLIETIFADGETAAMLRSLKESGQDLNALANQIESGEAN